MKCEYKDMSLLYYPLVKKFFRGDSLRHPFQMLSDFIVEPVLIHSPIEEAGKGKQNEYRRSRNERKIQHAYHNL